MFCCCAKSLAESPHLGLVAPAPSPQEARSQVASNRDQRVSQIGQSIVGSGGHLSERGASRVILHGVAADTTSSAGSETDAVRDPVLGRPAISPAALSLAALIPAAADIREAIQASIALVPESKEAVSGVPKDKTTRRSRRARHQPKTGITKPKIFYIPKDNQLPTNVWTSPEMSSVQKKSSVRYKCTGCSRVFRNKTNGLAHFFCGSAKSS